MPGNGKKTTKNGKAKTPKKSRCVSPKNGNKLTPGNPGNSGGKKGRSGRKPHAWKEFCFGVIHDPDVQKAITDAARDTSTPGYTALLKLLADHGEGVPAQTINLEGESPRERLATEVDRLVARQKSNPTT